MTELTWEGKYKDGKKVAPVRIALPFQNIETVNESAADRQKRLTSLFNQKHQTEWRNRLIWGDKKYVLPSLLPEFAGKVDLIYIDPPFNVGSDFSFTATIADDPNTEEDDTATFIKQPNIIEQKAYRDTWGKGLDSYMQWFYETVVLLRELLAENGSIYVHLDWHVGHYAKAVLDEIFGYDNLESQIIWQRVTGHMDKQGFGFNHDMILFYSKAEKFTWNPQYSSYDEKYLATHYQYKESDGRRYELDQISAAGQGSAKKFFGKFLEPPSGTHWRYSQEKIDKFCNEGKIVLTSSGRPRMKRYLDEGKGKQIQSVWADVHPVNSQAQERVNYSTQKPEALLERIIKASCNEGDLILDCFCGSGTTAATAEKLNRRWITCDLGRFAIHTARKRFLGIENVKPFLVQNLGKYERQQWMQAEFENPENRLHQEKTYKHFISELYHAKPLDGYTWIHAAKGGRMIHVGNVEAPVTVEDIKSTILEFWKLVGKEKSTTTNGIDFLGWDFAFDVNETAAQFAASNKVDVKFKKIPREVLEKKAVEQGDIKFYELASLNIKSKVTKQKIKVNLENFIIPPDDIPEEVRGNITHWSQWVDYWAIDWDYREDTFHNEWQSYRTKQNPKIDLEVSHEYAKKGKYTLLVKVIDILGNDTTKAIQIEI